METKSKKPYSYRTFVPDAGKQNFEIIEIKPIKKITISNSSKQLISEKTESIIIKATKKQKENKAKEIQKKPYKKIEKPIRVNKSKNFAYKASKNKQIPMKVSKIKNFQTHISTACTTHKSRIFSSPNKVKREIDFDTTDKKEPTAPNSERKLFNLKMNGFKTPRREYKPKKLIEHKYDEDEKFTTTIYYQSPVRPEYTNVFLTKTQSQYRFGRKFKLFKLGKSQNEADDLYFKEEKEFPESDRMFNSIYNNYSLQQKNNPFLSTFVEKKMFVKKYPNNYQYMESIMKSPGRKSSRYIELRQSVHHRNRSMDKF